MTVGVDHDGVLHTYSKGWYDGTIYDPPIPGAIEGLRILMEREPVFVFTARDTEQVATWLRGYGFTTDVDDGRVGTFWNRRGVVLVTNRKIPARAYLDDRAVRFTTWESALSFLLPPEGGVCAECGTEDEIATDLTDRWVCASCAMVDPAELPLLRSRLRTLDFDHATTLQQVARWVDEHGAEGLRERLADYGIALPTVLHGEWCLCATCRPDDPNDRPFTVSLSTDRMGS